MVRYKSDHRILSESNEAPSLAYLPTKLASSPLVKAVISHPALTAQFAPVGIRLDKE